MNKKNNARFQENDKKIRKAYLSLLKRYENPLVISVKEICAVSHIHHTTFYDHFDSVKGLADAVIRDYRRELNALLMKSKSQSFVLDRKGLEALVPFYRKNSFIIHMRLKYYGNEDMHDQCYQALKRFVAPRLVGFPEDRLHYDIEFLTAGFVYIICHWIEERQCLDSDEIIIHTLDAYFSGFNRVFRELQQKNPQPV